MLYAAPEAGPVYGISLVLPPWRGEIPDPSILKAIDMSTHTISITYTDEGSKGRYEASLDGVAEIAEMTLSKLSEQTIIVDHTGVPDALRGQGLANALAERAIADARAKGQKIVPLCPFLRSYAMKRKEELADVIQF